MNKLIFIFIDGLGIGRHDPDINPAVSPEPVYLSYFLDFPDVPDPCLGIVIPTDASLGLPGLPQSATGQTTLLTGVNSATVFNRHLSGFPNQPLRDLIKSHSLFKKLIQINKKGRFLNTFRPEFFALDEKNKWRMSATTLTNLAAGLPFFTLEDLKQRQSVYQDITNETLIKRGYNVPRFTPEQAGQIVVKQLEALDFILFEFFLTDLAGHSQNMEYARHEIHKLDTFIASILFSMNLKNDTLMISSDHGNIEDMSVKTHTTNPVLTKVWGKGQNHFQKQVKKLEHITPAISAYFDDN